MALERTLLALGLIWDLAASFLDAVGGLGGFGSFSGAFSFSDDERKAAPLAANARVRTVYMMGGPMQQRGHCYWRYSGDGLSKERKESQEKHAGLWPPRRECP